MRAGGVYGWFGALPSWLQMDQSCSEQQVRSDRAFSLGSAAATASAGASTKRRCRAEALECLEGGRLASLTGSSSRNQADVQPTEEDSDGEDEDDDPWSENLPDLGSSRVKAQPAGLSTSSRYSDESILQRQEKEAPATLHKRNAAVPTMIKCHNFDDTASLRDQGQGPLSQVVKHSSFGRHIKTALRLSSNGSDQSSGLSEPKVPSAVRLVDSRREHAWSRCGARHDWQCPGARNRPGLRNAFSPHSKWAPPPYSQPVKTPFGTQMAPALRQNRRGPHQTLGWNQPYWTPTVTAPKDVYHRVERRPLPKKPLPFHDVDLHQSVEETPDQLTVPANNGSRGQFTRRQVLAGTMICFSCLGLHHSYGVFQSYYTMHYPASNQTSIGFVGSTQWALMVGLCLLPANLRVVVRTGIVLGILLLSLGMFCTSWCTSMLSIWLAQGFFAGFGMALALQAGLSTTLASFSGRSALLILSLVSAGGYVGGIFYTLVINELLVRYTFATVMRILAGVVLLALLPPVVMMCLQNHREELRQQSALETRDFDFGTLLAALGIILAIFGLQFVPTYMPVFLTTATGLISSQGAHLLAIMCAIAVFGCSLTSLAIYRGVGTVTICGVCSVLSSITVLAWLDIPARSSFAKLAVISALYGFASSGVQVYCLAGLYAFGQESNEVAGYRRMRGLAGRIFGWLPHPGFGSLTTVVSLTALVGNPLAGALIQSHRSTESAKILAGVTLLAGGFVLLASNYVRLAKT